MAAPALLYPEAQAEGQSYGAVHPTSGLAGFPAIDFSAPAGTLAVAPEAGTIFKLSGSDPSVAPADPHGAYGLSEYLKGISGTIYFITHLGSRTVKLGEQVQRGQVIGTVADFPAATGGATPAHLHIGTFGPVSASQLAAAPKESAQDALRLELGAHNSIFGDANQAARHIPGVAQAEDFVGAAAGIPGDIAGVLKWPFEHNRLLRGGELLAGTLLVVIGLAMLTRGLTFNQAANSARPSPSMPRKTTVIPEGM